MDIEFHYWMTGLIALRAGFSDNEAQTIAYASEFVDENDVSITVKDRSGKKDDYSNFISQTMNILKPKKALMRIYPIFHFIPGEPDAITARRRDGAMHLLNTTPNSQNANEILDAAFKAGENTRLYRIGIASHAYVDTWAHQNFVGWNDHFNNIGFDPKPNVGHADGEHHPDWVSHIWIDERLVEADVSNKLRFISAAKALFLRYCEWLSSTGKINHAEEWSTLETELLLIMGATYSGNKNRYQEKRMESYHSRLNWLDFDERKWFDAAIDTKVKGLRDSPEGIRAEFTMFRDEYYWNDELYYEKTDWFCFQEAVKEHEHFAIALLTPTLHSMGVDLRVV